MKKIALLFAISALIYACGGNESRQENKESQSAAPQEESTPAETDDDLSSNPDYQKGLELIANADCLTCHKVDEKSVGPAYREVAAKYESTEANISTLADKIIHGGQGVWGSVPMTPHPDLSKADAEQMVKYVLLLKAK